MGSDNPSDFLDQVYNLVSRRDQPFRFWKTQPVPGPNETVVDQNGPVEVKNLADVRQTPLKLPPAYEWTQLDLTADEDMTQVYELLTYNYVEDDDAMFRFNYSPPFLQWALLVPEYVPDWHIGIRKKETNQLMAFISGIPMRIDVRGEQLEVAEINFLCVHKTMRSNRLAPVLIKEVTRRINLKNIWQAVYTAGVFMPKPISAPRYYHRALTPKKLVECRFTSLGPRMTMARYDRLNKLPEQTSLTWIPLETRHISRVKELLELEFQKTDLHPLFSEAELCHWLLPRKDVVLAFVHEVDGQVEALFSFFNLSSSILNNDKHSLLRGAYSFWNTCTSTVKYSTLMEDLLVTAKNEGYDVVNALNIMSNEDALLKDLRFGVGDGELMFYLYNWKTEDIKPANMGLVVL